MSTAATRSRKSLPRLNLSPAKGSEIFGVVLSAGVILLALSLASYHPADPSLLHAVAEDGVGTRNLIGPVGAHLAALAIAFLGLVSFLLPVLLGYLAWQRLARRDAPRVTGRFAGLLAVLPARSCGAARPWPPVARSGSWSATS